MIYSIVLLIFFEGILSSSSFSTEKRAREHGNISSSEEDQHPRKKQTTQEISKGVSKSSVEEQPSSDEESLSSSSSSDKTALMENLLEMNQNTIQEVVRITDNKINLMNIKSELLEIKLFIDNKHKDFFSKMYESKDNQSFFLSPSQIGGEKRFLQELSNNKYFHDQYTGKGDFSDFPSTLTWVIIVNKKPIGMIGIDLVGYKVDEVHYFMEVIPENYSDIFKVDNEKVGYFNSRTIINLEHRRKGYATKAKHLLWDSVFKNTNINKIIGSILATNYGSINGFKKIGGVEGGTFTNKSNQLIWYGTVSRDTLGKDQRVGTQ
ncbi:MAG: GNAT family N-acetyltransferase [Nitrospirota bacterium]